MATSSRIPEQNRPYQGYPFVNPVVIDVPTVDAATAAKWNNLPRKPIDTPVHKNTGNNLRNDSSSIYNVSNEAGCSSGVHAGSSQNDDNVPVVYIELPDEAEHYENASNSNGQQLTGQENTGFIQDTIFFDPFENRPIEVNRPKESWEIAGASGNGPGNPGPSATSDPQTNIRVRPTRPPPPRNLNIPGSSGGTSNNGAYLPGYMSKESQVYSSSGPPDGFNLSPLPVTDFPEPPPAYSEFAENSNRHTNVSTQRTVVVVPDPSPIARLPNTDRKLVLCQNCTQRVYTVVVKEYGPYTHLAAVISVLLCVLPVTALVYCTDYFKYHNHFCPNCNHMVGHEIPFMCQGMVFNGA